MIDLYIYASENIFQFLGVLFSIIYVVFSIKQSILCWPALIIGSIFNMLAYYQINLNLQLIMQFFFIGTGIIGWLNWSKTSKKNMLKVNRITLNKHLVWIFTGLLTTIFLTVTLKNYNLSEFPFFDSLMFCFNIIPMFMIGKKILESWIYFIVIDIISGFFYLQTGEYFFCLLFFCYIGFAFKGYLNWRKDLK